MASFYLVMGLIVLVVIAAFLGFLLSADFIFSLSFDKHIWDVLHTVQMVILAIVILASGFYVHNSFQYFVELKVEGIINECVGPDEKFVC